MGMSEYSSCCRARRKRLRGLLSWLYLCLAPWFKGARDRSIVWLSEAFADGKGLWIDQSPALFIAMVEESRNVTCTPHCPMLVMMANA